jgi:hypothetical protein
VHADSGKFFFANGASIAAAASFNPHARASRNAEGTDAEAGSSLNHGLLELPHVPHNVTPNSVEVENGIADDLAGTVIGDIAAAIGRMKFDAVLAQKVLGNAQVLAFAVAAESNDVGMFAKEQEIGGRADFARSNQALLERRGFAVSDPSEIKRSTIFHGRQCFHGRQLFMRLAPLCYYVRRNGLAGQFLHC